MGKETESHDLPARLRLRSANWWETANRWWTFAIKGVLGFAAILTFAVITNLFYEALFKRSIVIEPISVPKEMEEQGYTRDVAALHLLDALNGYAMHAHTSDAGPKLALHKDIADFALPNVGLSFKTVVARIRALLPISGSQSISGEITRIDGKLRLRLLKNEVVIHESWSERPHDKDLESPEPVDDKDLKALKTLFDRGALGVFAATRPYFEAVANSDKNPEVAFELAKRIIADHFEAVAKSDKNPEVAFGLEKRIIADRPSREDAMWARNLLGLLLYQRRMLDEHTGGKNTGSAIKEFTWVIDHPGFWDHDPTLAIAHLNRGLAYVEQGRAKDAIKDFESAIDIDPKLGIAHLKLGDLLNETGEPEKAGCEYLNAIAKFHRDVVSNPLSAVAHQRLGEALNNEHKVAECAPHSESVLKDLDVLNGIGPYDSAIAEYQRAAERDPDDAHFHYDLGVEWLTRGDVDKSIAELLEALDIRYDLGVKWLKRGEVDKSIDELLRVLDIRKGLNNSFDEFKYILLKKLSEARRIKDGNDTKAISLFDRAVDENNKALKDEDENGNAAAYKRLGADLYLMGEFETAVEAYDEAVRIDETYLASKIEGGYARFALASERAAMDFSSAADDFDHAAKDFDDALPFRQGQADTMKGQADTMIWLYLSREHSRSILGDNDHPDPSKELEDNASRLQKSNRDDWRIPIIKLFLRPFDQSPKAVLESARQKDECKAHFYVGEWYALHKPREEASDFLKQAKTFCQFYNIELSAANAELKRLKKGSEEVAAMGASPGPRRSRR